MRKFIQKFKIEVKLKDLLVWFGLSFIAVLLIYLFVIKDALSLMLLVQSFGFAVVFVVMMLMTKSYSQYIEGYYQGHINRHVKKTKAKS